MLRAQPALLNDSPAGTYEQADDATGMTTATVEGLDDATSGSEFREMGFSIEKVTVTARARALKAEYSRTGTGPQGDPRSGR